jgi:hypothetical protein
LVFGSDSVGAKLIARATSRSQNGCWWVLASVLAGLPFALEAHAQTESGLSAESEPQAFRVVFSSSSVCADPSEFVEQLQRRTTHLRAANAVEPALTLFVSLTSTQAGVQGHLRIQNVDGSGSSREVPGLDCHEVLSAMALIAALIVDPFALTTPELPPPPAAESAQPAEPSPPDTPPVRAGWSFGIGHRLNVNDGILPGLGWGQSVFAQADLPISGIFRPGVRLAGHLAHAIEETELRPSLGLGAFEWRAARLSLCPLLWAPERSVRLRPCFFADAGQLRASGSETLSNQKADVFWAAAGSELELEVTLVGPLTLGAEVGFMLPLVPRHWFYFLPNLDGSEVHRISSGLSAGLGLGLRFF